MNRLSFRPRPVDIHKKLPIVKSVRDLDNDEGVGVSRMVQHGHVALDSENELVLSTPSRRGGSEIPTPQFVSVESYERDYTQSFTQPASYVRGRGARNEGPEFVEYDMDDEDEDWLLHFNNERKILAPEKFEQMLYKMEVLDHKARERSVGMPTTLGPAMPVVLQREAAIEVLRSPNSKTPMLSHVYDYWKGKRERWQKPILRRLQPPPPVNDTNPFNVFRPREKIHRPHTRRMQRRENDVQSFDKLRQVHRSLEQARAVILAVQKREEKKRELVECEGNIQRLQIKYKHESEDGSSLFTSGVGGALTPLSRKLLFSSHHNSNNINGSLDAADNLTKKKRRRPLLPRGRVARTNESSIDSIQPVLLFTKALQARELAAAGIVAPSPSPSPSLSSSSPSSLSAASSSSSSFQFRGRMGRGGRIIFDRWNPLTRSPVGSNNINSGNHHHRHL